MKEMAPDVKVILASGYFDPNLKLDLSRRAQRTSFRNRTSPTTSFAGSGKLSTRRERPPGPGGDPRGGERRDAECDGGVQRLFHPVHRDVDCQVRDCNDFLSDAVDLIPHDETKWKIGSQESVVRPAAVGLLHQTNSNPIPL